MCRTCGKRHNSFDLGPSSGIPQDVNLEAGGSIPFSLAPGKLSPLRWHNTKEYEDYERIKQENFKLKLRIYLLEERKDQKLSKEDKDDLHKAYLELQVESEALKKQLYDKQELVRQASGLLTTLENRHKDQLNQLKAETERERTDLTEKISRLEKDLEDHSERCRFESSQFDSGDLTQLCGLAFSTAGDDGGTTSSQGRMDGPISSSAAVDRQQELQRGVLPARPCTLPGVLPASIQGIFSIPDESSQERVEDQAQRQRLLPSKVTAEDQTVCSSKGLKVQEENNRIRELENWVQELETRVVVLQDELGEKERVSEALEEDLQNLKKEVQEQEEKMADLEFEVTEKDQKVDQLTQDLETRRREIQAKDSTIQTLHDDLDKVEPEIEVKVQEIIERDRLIEEKIEQLQQQNKILVEIQITLDEKQKQIAELEANLQDAQARVQRLETDFEMSCQTIKSFTEEVLNRDKEIAQLKKDLKKKEKKIRDLIAELKESFEALKKAKWEAETNTGEDGMKEMVEEENERLWAELEQRKAEAANLRIDKEAALSQANAKMEALRLRATEAEERIRSLQAQMDVKDTNRSNDRDEDSAHHLEVELAALREKAASRESTLKEQHGVIEHLKGELQRSKDDLSERREEMRDLKKELSLKNADVQEFIVRELLGRSKEVKDLQGRLCDLGNGKDNHLEALKLFLKAHQTEAGSKELPTKAYQIQARSNSLTQIGNASNTEKKDGTGTQGSSRPARSNSLSLLENSLYAKMGQKVYNTNQTFNTYVLPGSAENKTTEATPLNETNVALPCHTSALKSSIQTALSQAQKKEASLELASQPKSKENGAQTERAPNTREVSPRLASVDCKDENTIQILYEEMNKLRSEVQALRQEREALAESLSSMQRVKGRSPRCSSERDDEAFETQMAFLKMELADSQKDKLAKEESHDREILDYHNQIQALKDELKLTRKRITLQVFELASRKYQDSVKHYKQEIASLRKRLADSHNACDLLRTRLEELIDFLEQILEMDRKGIINLSHLSASRRASLQKTLDDSRSLSQSLSHSLMIGTDSLLSESTLNDEMRFSLPLDCLPEEVDISLASADSTRPNSSRFDLPDEISQLDLSFDFSSQPMNGDLLYQKITSALNKQIDTRANEIDNVSFRLSQLSDILQQKDQVLQEKADIIASLQCEIRTLQDEARWKDSPSENTARSPISLQRSFSHHSSVCELLQFPIVDSDQNCKHASDLVSNPSCSSIGEVQASSKEILLSAHQQPTSVPAYGVDPLSQNAIFITQDTLNASTSSNTLPPPPCISSSSSNLLHPHTPRMGSDHEIEFYKDHHSDSTVCSAYSTDIMVKNLFLPKNGPSSLPKNSSATEKSLRNELASITGTLEQPNTPVFMLASPSESEAWSEPDRNVSLARIGLEACALATSHDRSVSRARMNRSTPLSSESDAEINAEEVKEGTPATQVISSGSKTKRRSEAAEVKRLSAKLRNVEQLNETLRAELHINQTLNQHLGMRKQESRSTQVCREPLPEPSNTTLEAYKGVSTEIAVHDDSVATASMTLSPPFLQEIRSLRMKLEEAIANNDLLRDQLEAALAGYLSEEMRNLTSTLAAAQQELKQNKDQLIAASTTEQLLRNECREVESKAYDLSERLADYMTKNQELQNDSLNLNEDIATLQSALNKKEKEVMSLRSLHAEEIEQFNLNSAKMEQLQVEVSNLRCKLHSSQQDEMEKDVRIKQQSIYISSLEEAKADCESRLSEQDTAINDLCQRITNLQKENDSSCSNKLIQKLQESETRLLQVTKESFALHSEKSRLQAQLASARTEAKLLQKEICDMSDSDRSSSSSSEIDYNRIAKRLRESHTAIKVLEREHSLWNIEKQALMKQLELLQGEVTSLQAQVDHFRTQEARQLTTLQFSDMQLQEKLSHALKEKEALAERLRLKERQLQRLQSLAVLDNSDATLTSPSSATSIESLRPRESHASYTNFPFHTSHNHLPSHASHTHRPSQSPSPPPISEYPEAKRIPSCPSVERDTQRKRGYSWGENKENVGSQTPYRSTHLLLPPSVHHLPPPSDEGVLKESILRSNIHHPHQQRSIDDDATSGESPDLGIGSDGGQFSSLERNLRSATKMLGTRSQSSASRQAQLCTDPSHSRLVQDNEYLKMAREELSEKLADTKEKLRDALEQQAKANRRKESIERAISRQLSKTTDVLRRTRVNARQSKGQSIPKGHTDTVK